MSVRRVLFAGLAALFLAPYAHEAAATIERGGDERCERVTIVRWLQDPVPLFGADQTVVSTVPAIALSNIRVADLCEDMPDMARIRVGDVVRYVDRASFAARSAAASARPPPTAAADEPSEPPAPPTRPRTPSMERVTTPVIVELAPDQARAARQGGSAVVLLAAPTSNAAQRVNSALCASLFRAFDQAEHREIGPGVRVRDGEVQLLRPVYWLTRAPMDGLPGAAACPQRLETYDFARSDRIRRKFNLTSVGPYLLVERVEPHERERVAAIVDLSRARPQDVDRLVRYFRDGLLQRGDVWSPDQYAPARVRGDLVAFGGGPLSDDALPRLIRVTQQIGCPLANLLDICDPR